MAFRIDFVAFCDGGVRFFGVVGKGGVFIGIVSRDWGYNVGFWCKSFDSGV